MKKVIPKTAAKTTPKKTTEPIQNVSVVKSIPIDVNLIKSIPVDINKMPFLAYLYDSEVINLPNINVQGGSGSQDRAANADLVKNALNARSKLGFEFVSFTPLVNVSPNSGTGTDLLIVYRKIK